MADPATGQADGFASIENDDGHQSVWSQVVTAVRNTWEIGTGAGIGAAAGGLVGYGAGYATCYVAITYVSKNLSTGLTTSKFCAEVGKVAGEVGGGIIGGAIGAVVNDTTGAPVVSNRNGPAPSLAFKGMQNDGNGEKSWSYQVDPDQTVVWHTKQASAAGKMTITKMDVRGNDTGNHLEGNDAANYFWGNQGNDHLFGLGGADTLLGGAGRDNIFGGSGADLLDPGSGAGDLLHGGSGADTFRFSAPGTATIDDFTAGLDHTVGQTRASAFKIIGVGAEDYLIQATTSHGTMVFDGTLPHETTWTLALVNQHLAAFENDHVLG